MVECDRCHRKFVTYEALKQHYSDQHPNAKWSEGYENQLTNEKNLQTYKASVTPGRRSHTKLIIASILLVVIIGGAGFYLSGVFSTGGANSACASFPFPTIAGQDLSEHYHAIVMIFVNGQRIPLPYNIGEGDAGPCTQPLHVHQSDPGGDVIHIESPQTRSYTLGEFFKVWAATPNIGGPTPVVFNQNQIFNYTVGNGYELRMYVNGQESTIFDSLALQSHMIVVIVYGNASTNWSQFQQNSAQAWPYSNL